LLEPVGVVDSTHKQHDHQFGVIRRLRIERVHVGGKYLDRRSVLVGNGLDERIQLNRRRAVLL
jgi:hypothetical protein